MEPGRIAEDKRARRSFKNHVLRCWNLPLHFPVRRIGYSKRIVPREQLFVGPSNVATREVLHCAGVPVNPTEIEKGTNLPAVLGIAMPALRKKPRIRVHPECGRHANFGQGSLFALE